MPGNRSLSGLDAAFLYREGLGTPIHAVCLMLLQPPKGFKGDFHQRLRDHVADRLASAAPLRRVLESAPMGLGRPH